jgi:hypothetical protein
MSNALGEAMNDWKRFAQTENWHPAANIYPLMSDSDLDKLADDIANHDLLTPMVLIQEGDTVKLLDGRNRALALNLFDEQSAEDLFVASNFVYWKPTSTDDTPTSYVVSQNTHRRHLTKDQLTIVAAKIAIAFEVEAKAKMVSTLKKGKEKPAIANLQYREEPSVVKAAKAVNDAVSPRQVSHGVKLVKEEPEIAEQVARGEKKVAQAKKEARAKKPAAVDAPNEQPAAPEPRLREKVFKHITDQYMDVDPEIRAREIRLIFKQVCAFFLIPEAAE